MMNSGDSSVWTRLRELVRSRNGPRYQQVGLNGEATKFKGASRMRNVILALTTVVIVAILYVYVSSQTLFVISSIQGRKGKNRHVDGRRQTKDCRLWTSIFSNF